MKLKQVTALGLAAALGLTRSGVYMRLTRARRLLGDFLKEGSR